MKKIFKLLFRWSFLLSYGVAWLLCHGWAFAGTILGPALGLSWLTIASGFWIGLMLMPNGFGLLIPMPLAFIFQKLFFPRDENLKKDLQDAFATYKKDLKEAKEKRKAEKIAKKEAKKATKEAKKDVKQNVIDE